MTAPMRVSIFVRALVVGALVGASPATGQISCPDGITRVRIAPSYLNSVDGDDAFGIDGSLLRCRTEHDTRPRFPHSQYYGIQFAGVVPVFGDRSIPQNLEASTWFGYSVGLSERAPDTGGALDDLGPPFAFDYGFAGVGGRLHYESSSDFEEQALAAGGEVRFVNPRWPVVPSLVLTGIAVLPTISELRDSLDLDRELHWRARVRGYWLLPLGRWLEAEADASYFRGFGLDDALDSAGMTEGAYVAGSLGLLLQRPIGGFTLESIFLGYAHGQQPTDEVTGKAWTVGVRFGGR